MKIDVQIDLRVIGQFARLSIQVNFSEPFVLKICVANRVQHVEYESLPSICFSCRRFGYSNEVCPHSGMDHGMDDIREKSTKMMVLGMEVPKVQDIVESEDFGN